MNNHKPTSNPNRARPSTHPLTPEGAQDERNPDGTYALGNPGPWKHGAYSKHTRQALVDSKGAAIALAEHRQEIETDLGSNASRLKRDLVQRYVETAALADHLGWQLTHRGPLTAKGHARAALSAYLQVLDRQHRLAVALGLERRTRQVEDVDRYLDRFSETAHK